MSFFDTNIAPYPLEATVMLRPTPRAIFVAVYLTPVGVVAGLTGIAMVVGLTSAEIVAGLTGDETEAVLTSDAVVIRLWPA